MGSSGNSGIVESTAVAETTDTTLIPLTPPQHRRLQVQACHPEERSDEGSSVSCQRPATRRDARSFAEPALERSEGLRMTTLPFNCHWQVELSLHSESVSGFSVVSAVLAAPF